jgi:hypothetical protein
LSLATVKGSPDIVKPDRSAERPCFAARIGAFFLLSESLDPADLQRRVVDALRQDARVSHVDDPPRSATFFDVTSVFPGAGDAGYSMDLLIFGHDRRRSVQFRTPIVMNIRVPKREQPNNTASNEIAAEEYVVVWDGRVIVVAWLQEARYVPHAGGQIAANVLRAALEQCDAELYIQACSPQCAHLFTHVTALVREDESLDEPSFALGETPFQSEVRVPSRLSTPADAALAVFRDCAPATAAFAAMKNISLRILDLERAARSDLHHLMRLYYLRAHIREYPVLARPRMYWRVRRWRGDSRFVLARLWVTLSALEDFRRQWTTHLHLGYADRMHNADRAVLFAQDEPDEFAAITSLDTAQIQRGIEEASDRLAYGALVFATAGTGIAAITGVIVGRLL